MYDKNTHFIFYSPYPFCAYFERYMLSPKIRAKRVRVIKDNICILKIQDTFVLSLICQKCQDTQIKAFLCFKRWLFVFFSLIPKHKNAFIWVCWHFWHMLEKTKVSRMIKIQILSFMTQTLFARILGDSIYLSKYARDICYLLKYAQKRLRP